MKIDWKHLETLSDFEKLKYLLSIEDKDNKVNNIDIGVGVFSNIQNPFIPKDRIDLQFCGYEIILNKDGTWTWEDTTGG